MKTQIAILLLIICATMNAQNKTFLSAGEEQAFIISPEGNYFNVYIQTRSSDPIYNIGYLIMEKFKYEKFITELKEAKETYLSYVEIAKENKITSYLRNISSSSLKYRVGFQATPKSDFLLSKSSDLNFNFFVAELKSINQIGYILSIETDRLNTSNKFIDSKPHYIWLKDIAEIDDFIKVLEELPKTLDEKKEIDSLFE